MAHVTMLRMSEIIPHAIQRRLIATLFVSQSLFSAAQIAAFVVMPIISVELSGSATSAGLPSTFFLLGRAAAAYPAGWLMGRLGRRIGLSLGFLIATAGAILSVLAIGWISFAVFSLGALFGGMGRGVSELARYAAAEVQTPDKRAKAIGLIVFAGTVGAIVGPLLVVPSSHLAVRLSLDPQTGPYIVAALLTWVSFVLIFIFLRPDPMLIGRALSPGDEGTIIDPVEKAQRSLGQIFGGWPVRLALLAMVIGQLVMTLLMVITPLHMNQAQHDTQAISWVIMAHTLGMFGLSGVTGWLIDRAGQSIIIAAGALVLASSAIIAPLTSTVPGLAVALFLLGLSWNFCFIAGSSLLSSSLRPDERGRTQGASDTMVSLASGAGSLSTGFIFALGGMTAISAVGLSFALLLLGATVWIGRAKADILVAPEF